MVSRPPDLLTGDVGVRGSLGPGAGVEGGEHRPRKVPLNLTVDFSLKSALKKRGKGKGGGMGGNEGKLGEIGENREEAGERNVWFTQKAVQTFAHVSTKHQQLVHTPPPPRFPQIFLSIRQFDK